jgi:citronellol/citronellal dehydrogenase
MSRHAKTEQPNPKLPGTIYTAAEEIAQAGGQALPIPCDIRDEAGVQAAAKRCAEHFGGIDILVNNASAISLTGTLETPMKRFDLMFGVNVRGTYCVSQACIPFLKTAAQAGRNPHILNLSPPLNLNPRWFKNHVAYTMAKYGMSMCVLGMAEELRADGIAVNALWPRTVIATAALAMLPGVDPKLCRRPHPRRHPVFHPESRRSRHRQLLPRRRGTGGRRGEGPREVRRRSGDEEIHPRSLPRLTTFRRGTAACSRARSAARR